MDTILKFLQYRTDETPSSVVIHSEYDQSWTYKELLEQAHKISSLIPASIQPRIGIVMKNGPDLTFSILGATLVGCAAPLNPNYELNEFKAYFKQLQLTCVLLDNQQKIARQAAAELSLPVIDITNKSTISPYSLTPPKANDIALLLLTSGSTGTPKIVPLSHKNLCVSAKEISKSVQLTARDICLSMWELYHIGGLVDLLLAPIISGGKILSTRGFNTSLFFSSLEEKLPTWFQAVPTALNEIVTQAKRENIKPSKHNLRFIRSVAAKLPEELRLEVEALFGVPVIQTFGMTEAGPLITSTRLPPEKRKPNSVGKSWGTQIQILDQEGRPLPAGKVGEVAIQGDNVFTGYEGDLQENNARFRKISTDSSTNWFLTGDLAKLDTEGELFLAGRTKTLINRGGEKINPQEVEDTLRQHKDVDDAAVFSTPHKTLGEDIAAAVIIKPQGNCLESELKTFLSQRIISFKVPYRILILDALPLTPVGKLDRAQLKIIASQHLTDSPQINKNETEVQLTKIWKKELNLQKIGAEENFFAIGGDSLAGVRIMMAIENWLGQPAPPSLMGGISTIREMAKMLEFENALGEVANSPSNKSELIRHIEILMQSSEIPTLEKHPAIGYSKTVKKETVPPLFWCFNNPDKEMQALINSWPSSQKIYGLYSGSKLGEGNAAEEVIKEVARYYAEMLPQIVDGKPFFIGGNCRGARVVVELLNHLTEAKLTPIGVTLLEYGYKHTERYSFPSMFIFGASSAVSKPERKEFIKAAKTPANNLTVVKTRGAHGQFFSQKNISSLTNHLQTFININTSL